MAIRRRLLTEESPFFMRIPAFPEAAFCFIFCVFMHLARDFITYLQIIQKNISFIIEGIVI